MGIRVAPGAATALAAFASGLLLALGIQVGGALFANGAIASALSVAVVGVALGWPTSFRSRNNVAAGLGAIGLWRAEDVAKLGWRMVGADLLPWILPILFGFCAALLVLPLRDPLRRFTRLHLVLTAAGLMVGAQMERGWLIVAVLAAGGADLLVSAPLRRTGSAAAGGPRAMLGVAMGALVGTAAIAVLRAPVDPSAAVLPGMVVAGLLAAVVARGWAGALFGLLTGAAAVGLPLLRPDLQVPLPSGWPLVAMAAAAGAWIGAAGAGRRTGVGAVAGVLLSAGILPLVPVVKLPKIVQAGPTLSDSARRTVPKQREGMAPVWAGLDTWGGASAVERNGQLLVELDGTVVTASLRAARAERFAGMLAGCLAEGRAHARVAGDSFGRALPGLFGQGFLTVDVAAPVPGLYQALAARTDTARRTWLHPSVRLLPVPGPLVLRAGAPADAVVEVMGAPWSDGLTTLPDARALRAVRAGLRTGGVWIGLVDTRRWTAAALSGLAHDVGATFSAASLWLAPDGLDHVLLVGASGPVPWAQLGACRAADPESTRLFRFGDDRDLAAQAHLDDARLVALPWAPRPARIADAVEHDVPLLLSLPDADVDPTTIFDASAPADALRQRQEARRAFLRFLAAGGATAPTTAPVSEPTVEPWLARAREALQRARQEGLAATSWEEAETAIATARRIAPESAAAACLDGDLHVARTRFVAAETAFAECVELDTGMAAGWDGLALVRRQRGDLVGAEAALRSGVAGSPDRWQSRHNLGYLLNQLGRTPEAEAELLKAVALAGRGGDAPEPHLALADLYLDTREPARALVESERALTLASSAEGWYLHGAANWELGHREAAERDFRKALEVDPRQVGARGGLGLAQVARGDFQGAAESFKAVLAADPRNEVARKNLEEALRQMGGRP